MPTLTLSIKPTVLFVHKQENLKGATGKTCQSYYGHAGNNVNIRRYRVLLGVQRCQHALHGTTMK